MIDSYVLKSKERELVTVVYFSLQKQVSDFKSKLRGYFSRQEKEVIKNIKSDNIAQYSFYDNQKYLEKLIKLYSEQVTKIMKKALDRAVAESEVEYTDEVFKFLVDKYVKLTITSIADGIEKTTRKKLTKLFEKYKRDELSKDEFLNEVIDYYENQCKSWRSKEIALTETFRTYNFTYLTYMSNQGYVWKKWIAGYNAKPDGISMHLNGQVKFYLEQFVYIPENLTCLYPPIHPWDTSIILCLKEK